MSSLVGALFITACYIQQSQPVAPGPAPAPGQANYPPGAGENQPQQQTGLANGEYACSFTVSSYRYPEYPCVVFTRRDGRQVLEKTAGSQRIHGVVTPTPDGFSFQGTFYCPMGSCTEELGAQFQGSGGQYQGALHKQSGARQILVQLRHLPQGFAASGIGYGGARYGGARYGGARYGGARYRSPGL